LVLFVAASVVGRRVWLSRRDPARLDLLYQAWAQYDAGHPERANALLERRLKEVPPTAMDWLLRARIAEKQGRPGEALRALEQIPDTDAYASQARLKTGQMERARHHARAAETALLRSAKLEPEQTLAYRELAYLYAVQLRRSECDAQFRTLAELVPMGPVLAFAWCQNFTRIWDPYAARKFLEPCLVADPEDRNSRLALATSFELSYELDEAETVLRVLSMDDPDARAVRARIAMTRGDAAAAKDLAQGGPDDHGPLNVLRGQFALRAGDASRAATRFRAALRSDPEDRDAIRGLGQALRALGEPEAERLLQRAAHYDQLRRTIQDSVSSLRTDPKLFYKLGELCASIDHPVEARVWYHLAIESDPLDTQAQQALTRLERSQSGRDGRAIIAP
jgi:predicted Zn-dependent protease